MSNPTSPNSSPPSSSTPPQQSTKSSSSSSFLSSLTSAMEPLTTQLASLSRPSSPPPSDPLPIPGPPGLPFVGNMLEIDPTFALRALMQFADTYGPIYKMYIGPSQRVVISSAALVEEVSDEKRFQKCISGPLEQVRHGVGSGLFTAYHGEKEWGIAHRVLMPAFGPLAIKGMFDRMHDIASQLVMKWARHGPTHSINVTDDFTRLALDTIALCSMDYRFNSYYSEELHPFIAAMGDFLVECGRKSTTPAVASLFRRAATRKFDADIKLMVDLAQDLVRNRRARGPAEAGKGGEDLLDKMIHGRDPKTGEGMTDSSISENLITFLIAGHETTSGLLSFAFHNLIRHSSAYRAAQKEVDEVCGKGPITLEQLSKLPYIDAVLRETLRLTPTAPIWTVSTSEDTTLGGKWQLGANVPIMVLLSKAQSDPTVYGPDASQFRPERMLDAEFEKLPKGAWKPFGNGVRGCIGRAFAWQESRLVMALLLQNFNFNFVDPGYELHLKQTLTIKPKDLYMRATLREGVDAVKLTSTVAGVKKEEEVEGAGALKKDASSDRRPMSIYYGSNTGTCEGIAQRLATSAAGHGFGATVSTLDAATEKLPRDQPVVFITASFEGQPPDNATHFVEWLKDVKGSEAEGLSYAVFGCGHRDWKQTYQAIPKLVDSSLAARGGTRLVGRGEADAAGGDMFTDFDAWEDNLLWPSIVSKFGGTAEEAEAAALDITISTSTRSTNLRQDVRAAVVVESKRLTPENADEKRHLELRLPSDMSYRAGDYLNVLPLNPDANVRQLMARFRLPYDATLRIASNAPTTLPTDQDLSVQDLLSAYVELSMPATKKQMLQLAEATEDTETKAALLDLTGDKFSTEITAARVSPRELLMRFPKLEPPFASFLALLPPMRPRQYSISSSPLANPETCTLTFAVLSRAALSGHGRFAGVASSYLAQLQPGDTVQVAVRTSPPPFHLPLSPADTPVIMAAAGAGVAPFRGFVQERACMVTAGRKLAPALLFLGVREKLYEAEFKKWEEEGAIKVYWALSRNPSETAGCKYVQERMLVEAEEARNLWDAGAKVFICGSSQVGDEVRGVCKRMYAEKVKELGEEIDEKQVEEWFQGVKEERFATDVFA